MQTDLLLLANCYSDRSDFLICWSLSAGCVNGFLASRFVQFLNAWFVFFHSTSLPGRLQRGLSVETGQRQRSVPQPQVHPVWTGRRVEVLQQTRREPRCLQLSFPTDFNTMPPLAVDFFTFCRPESRKPSWRSARWTQRSSRPRSAPPTACSSPTWRTTAPGTFLFITRMER